MATKFVFNPFTGKFDITTLMPSDDGTSGQVLTSNGSGAAPSWTTVTSGLTQAQVLARTHGS